MPDFEVNQKRKTMDELSGSLKERNVSWNVVDGDTYKGIIREVFNAVAERIGFTMGPYGGDTIFEKGGQTAMTKDGWTVLKNIHYDDPVYNSILNLLKNVCAQVVIKVGDGSSSAVCAANNIYTLLMESDIMDNYRAKDVVDEIENVCTIICDKILEMSNKINPDGDLSEIYDIALTSTNQNKEFANIILDIYKETKNPTIELVEARGAKTSYEIVNGFRGMGVYLDRVYQTSDDGRCEVDNPYVLAFDFKISKEEYDAVIQPVIRNAVQEERRVVVYAPYYEDSLLEAIRYQANQEFKALGTTAVVYCRAPIAANDLIDNYRDFVLMLGGTMISQTIMNDLMPKYEFNTQTKQREKIEDAKMIPQECVGTCLKLTISDKNSMISGVTNMKENEYEVVVRDIKAQLKKSEEESENLNIVSNRSFSLKKRLSRLSGSMGVIYVGGRTLLEKNANMDSFDDAVKACDSAFTYGYNIGGSLIIPIVCEMMSNKIELVNENVLTISIYQIISSSMQKVLYGVLEKYYSKNDEEDKHEITSIIDYCIKNKCMFDLIGKKYSDNVVNPCMTDIEVLKASSTMASLLLSSNQYISITASEDVF